QDPLQDLNIYLSLKENCALGSERQPIFLREPETLLLGLQTKVCRDALLLHLNVSRFGSRLKTGEYQTAVPPWLLRLFLGQKMASCHALLTCCRALIRLR